MKRYITLLAICVLAGVMMAPQAQAQCAAGITNPLQALLGSWGFHTEEISILSTNPPPIFVAASAGRFTATIGADKNGTPIGLLSVIDTTSKNLGIFRLMQQGGKYQIFPDCSGGVLMFDLGTVNLEFDFWFVNGGTELYMIGNDPGTIATGVAKRV